MSDLIERLRKRAHTASEISRSMSEAKSLRQDGNDERLADLYAWIKPEQTVEWQAADRIAALEAEVERLRKAGDGLGNFARHALDCDNMTDVSHPGSPCSCGYSHALTHWQEVSNG